MVLNQNGIFSRAENSAKQWNKAGAREELELVLDEVQMAKYEEGLLGENYENRLDNKIQEIGELLDKDINNPNYQQVIVEGSIFLIDRSVPMVVEYVGPADGVVITASVSGNGGWFKQEDTINVTVTGIIKTYSGGTITTVSATKGEAAITGFSIAEDGKYTINNITADTTIEIKAKDSNNKENSKTIPITIKVDNIAPTLSVITATAEARRIKIKAVATDNESGLKQINYSVSPTTVNRATGTLSTGQEITLTATTSEEYTITFTAEDNAGNISTSQSKTVETLGVIKHIKTPTGLKEVNTADIYGTDVLGYNCERRDVAWQLFYIDEDENDFNNNKVYLIAKDYAAPPTKLTELSKSTDKNHPKAYYFNSTLLDKYKYSIPNTTFTQKFLKEYMGTSAETQRKLQSINYLLDQDVWKEYKIELSDYAFGGPTLPLFISSFNDTCKRILKLAYQKGEKGYQISKGGSSFADSQSGLRK